MEQAVALNGHAPKITVVAAPRAVGAVAERIDFHRERLAAEGSVDGVKMLAQAIDDDGTIRAFASAFSTVLALHELTRAGRYDQTKGFALGPIGVNALLENESGMTLWGKRHGRSVGGGAWHVIPSGMYDSGRDPEEMLLQEANEELGLQPVDFLSLEPLLVVHVAEQISCVQIVYRAIVANDVALELNPEEHSELCWVMSPNELQPLLDQGLGIWRASQKLAQA